MEQYLFDGGKEIVLGQGEGGTSSKPVLLSELNEDSIGVYINFDFTGYVKLDLGGVVGDSYYNDHFEISARLSQINVTGRDLTYVFESGGQFTVTDFLSGNSSDPIGRNFAPTYLDLFAYGVDQYVAFNPFDEFDGGEYFLGTSGADFTENAYSQSPWELDVPVYAFGLGGDDLIESSPVSGGLLSGDAGNDVLRTTGNTALVLGGVGDDVLLTDNGNPSVASLGSGDDIYMFTVDQTAMTGWSGYGGRGSLEPVNNGVMVISDTAGAADTIFLQSDYPAMTKTESGSYSWMSAKELINSSNTDLSYDPFAADLNSAIYLNGSDLEFRFSINDRAWPLGFIPTTTTDWSWRPEGVPRDGEYDFGMTYAEKEALDIRDISTYPGFNDLNSDAQEWLKTVLQDAHPSLFEQVINNLAAQAAELLPRAEGLESFGVFRTASEGYPAATARTSGFDVNDYSTYPVLPFTNVLATANVGESWAMWGGDGLYNGWRNGGLNNDFGFTIKDFTTSSDTIESIVRPASEITIGDDGLDPVDRKFNEVIDAGKVSVPVAVKQTLDWAVGQNYLERVLFDRDGVATGNTGPTILVSQGYGYSGTQPVYVFNDAKGAVQFSRDSKKGSEIQNGDKPWFSLSDSYLIGGAGDDILMGAASEFALSDPGYFDSSIEYLIGNEGSDWFEAGKGTNYLFGGAGSDVFIIREELQQTTIVGGDWAYTDERGYTYNDAEFSGVSGYLPTWQTFADASDDYVYVDWYRDETIFRVLDSDIGALEMINTYTGAVVHLYEIDKIFISDRGDASQPYVIDLESIFADRVPVTIDADYSKEKTSFLIVNGTRIKVFDDGKEIGIFEATETSELVFRNETVHLNYVHDTASLGITPIIDAAPNNGIDFIFGFMGQETVDSTGGDDYVFGDQSDNILYGGDGDDYLDGGDGNDEIYGGAGDDWLRSGWRFPANQDDFQTDYLYGEAGDDILEITSSGNTFLDGGDGVDTLLIDLSRYPNTDFVVYTDFENNIQYTDKDEDRVQSDYFYDIENYTFKGSIDQIIYADSAANVLITGSGDDTFYIGNGSSGQAHPDNDTVDAGAGIDRAVYYASAASSEVTYELVPQGAVTVLKNISNGEVEYEVSSRGGVTTVKHLVSGAVDKLVDVELIEFLDSDGIAIGVHEIDAYAGYEVIKLSSGDDIYFGGDGSEWVETGGGADSIYTGGGDDIIVVQGDTGSGTLKVRGEAGNDRIIVKDDFTGKADLNAGAGSDSVDFYAPVLSSSINPDTGDLNVLLADGSTVTLKGQLVKDASGNWVASQDAFESYRVISKGADGEEIIDEMPLSDILYGTKDADTLGSASSTEDQKIFAFDGDDQITGGLGNDFIDAGAGNDEIVAGAGDDIVLGGLGDDKITGGKGNDRLEGGSGNDTYVHSTASAFEDQGLDTIIENSGGDADRVMVTRKLWNFTPDNDYSSIFDNRAPVVKIEDGNLTVAAVDDIDSTVLEGFVIQDFAKQNSDGSYINTVEFLQYVDGGTFKLSPSGLVDPNSTDRYYLVANSDSVQKNLTTAGTVLGADGVYSYYTGSDTGRSFSAIAESLPEYSDRIVMMGGAANDTFIGQSTLDEVLIGNDGSDWFIAQGGANVMIGGRGDDVFHIEDMDQQSVIFGDYRTKDPDGWVDGEPRGSKNASYADKVLIEWSWEESLITRIGGDENRNAFYIEKMVKDEGTGRWEKTNQFVKIYDVEYVLFQNKDEEGNPTGQFTEKLLGRGKAVGASDWQSSHLAAGENIDYDKEKVSFVVAGNNLKVYADITVSESYTYTEKVGKKNVIKTGTKLVEYPDELIWEGARTEVAEFNFKNTTVNVVNITEDTFLHNPNDAEPPKILTTLTVGTEGVDIIFGDSRQNLIDGKGGDDLIFGGGGDDVLIGGEGDDALIGGDGSDILRGDGADSLAVTKFNEFSPGYFQTFSDTPDYAPGNDLLIGGDGIDDIATGGGDDLVAADRLDRETFHEDGTVSAGSDTKADIQTINQEWTARDKLFEDDEWI